METKAREINISSKFLAEILNFIWRLMIYFIKFISVKIFVLVDVAMGVYLDNCFLMKRRWKIRV